MSLAACRCLTRSPTTHTHARFKDFEADILQYHDLKDPYSLGASTGWSDMDPVYK